MGHVSVEQGLFSHEVVSHLLAGRQQLLVVSGSGFASRDVMAAGDHPHNYYLRSSTGSAAMVGLGLAHAQPEQSVAVIISDGEMLKGLSSLATIGLHKPVNLTIVVLDNRHVDDGGLATYRPGVGIALDKVADSFGFDWTHAIRSMEGVSDLREWLSVKDGLKFMTIRVDVEERSLVMPPRDGCYIKARFRAALGLCPL